MNRHAMMGTAATQSTRLSIDGFFDWARFRAEKYELVEGTPKMQPWVKRGHSVIVGNIDFLLQSGIDRQNFSVHQGDFAIETGPTSIRYADLLVEPAGHSVDERTTKDALLIVEVLSETTMHIDFGAKRIEYLGLASLDTYLIVAQDSRCVWQWTRDEQGEWPENPLLIEEGDVEIARLNARLPLAEIYRNVSS